MRNLVLLILLCLFPTAASVGQITSLSGELRYQHQYQDVLDGRQFSTSLQRTPTLSLSTSGVVLSPMFLTFDLQTFLTSSWTDAHSGPLSLSGQQTVWNFYDLTAVALKNFPIVVMFGARDGIQESVSETGDPEFPRTRNRRQEQRLTMTTRNIVFLPLIRFSWLRNHQWSTLSPIPTDQRSNDLSVNVSAAAKTSSISVTANANDIDDRYLADHLRYFSLQLNGTKEFSEESHVDVSSNYDRFGETNSMDGTLSYTDKPTDRLRLYSSITGRSYTSATYTSYTTSAGPSIQYTLTEHLRSTFNLNGQYGRQTHLLAGISPDILPTYGWSAGGSLQHNRATVFGNFSNSITLNAGVQQLRDRRTTTSIGFANGYQRSFSGYQLSANHTITTGWLQNSADYRYVSNSANATLTGSLYRNTQTNTIAIYQDERYAGESAGYRNRREIRLQENMTGSFNSVIPFSLTLNGNINWYLAGNSGRTYGWGLTVTSVSFFTPRLTAMYRLSRAYDLYYQRSSLYHTVEFRYPWRAIRLEVRLVHNELLTRNREAWFSISRPF